jgi:hypothetical protein
MYIVIKDYPEHGFKIGDEVGMNPKFAKKLIKDKIITAKAEKE